MPCDYRIDVRRNLVISRAWGRTTDQDLISHASRLARDPGFLRGMAQIADLRHVTHLAATSSGIRHLASLNPFGTGAKRAVLAGSDVVYGMARMYQMLRDSMPDDLQVFREPGPAIEWLGLADAADEILPLLADPSESES